MPLGTGENQFRWFPMTKQGRLERKIQRLLRRLGWPRWLHRYGPKRYEVRQHLMVLLIWSSLPVGFRRAVALLRDLGQVVPTYSAVAKFFHRLSTIERRAVLAATTRQQPVAVAAIDSTCFGRSQPSYHYLRRIDGKTPRVPVKWSILVATNDGHILATRGRVRPAHDTRDVKTVLDRCTAPVKKLVGDKGYDSERVHQTCHERGIISIIPIRRNVKKGFYRRKMQQQYTNRTYGRRSRVETTFSVIKRRTGGSIRCHRARNVRAELEFRAAAYNLKVAYQPRLSTGPRISTAATGPR